MIETDPSEALVLIDRLRSPATAYVDAGQSIPAELMPISVACEEQRVAAVEAIAASKDDEDSISEVVASGWSDFISEWLAPVGLMALVWAISIATLAISARFASLVPGVRNGVSGKAAGLLAGVFGFAGIVAGSLGALLTMASVGDVAVVTGEEWIALGMWLLLALVGVTLLGLALASRLRLALDVRGADGKRDEWASARAAGVLSEMGGAPAQGVTKPEGSDIEALSNAIPEFGGANWSGIVGSVTRFLFLGTPWRVTIDTDFARFAVVSIYRNGAPVALQRIDLPDGLTTPTPIDAIDAYAAAIIVITLSKAHDGFEGLSGASNWVSIGQYFLASRYDEFDPNFQRLARAAVQKDPRNYVARFALRNTAGGDDAEYVAWLRAELEAIRRLPRGSQPLEVELRARRILGNTEIQLHSEGELAEPERMVEMASNVVALVKGLRQSEKRQTVLYQLLRSDAAVLVRDLQVTLPAGDQMQRSLRAAARHSQAWFAEARASLYPDVAYNLACHFALRGESELALKHLRIAVTDPELKSAARTDPEFNQIRGDEQFVGLVSDVAKSSYWDIDYFSRDGAKLRESGLREPGDLESVGNLQDVRKYIGLHAAPFRKLRRACDLVRRAQLATGEVDVEGLEVELVAAMLALGVFSVEAIPAEWLTNHNSGEFVLAVNDLNRRCGATLAVSDAVNWLAVVRR